MLDIKQLRQDPDGAAQRLLIRGFNLDTVAFRALEEERRQLQSQTEQLQHERNARSKAIGAAKAQGEDIAPLVAEVADLGQRLNAAKAAFTQLQERLQGFLSEIPNLPDASVPEGEDEADNLELRTWGRMPQIDFEPLDHVDLGAGGALDFAAAAKISGARFVVMKGEMARLHRALTQFMLDTHIAEHGYTEVYAPYIVNSASLFGTGQLPKFAAAQFAIAGDVGLHLIPTAEVPVTNLYRDAIIDADALPIRHVCHTPCFRSEAGSYGKDTRGMIRQHQFEKVELVQLVRPEDSWQALEGADRPCGGHPEDAGIALSGGGAVRRGPRFRRRQDHRPGGLAAGAGPLSGDLLVQQLSGLSGAAHDGPLQGCGPRRQ